MRLKLETVLLGALLLVALAMLGSPSYQMLISPAVSCNGHTNGE